MEKKMKIVKWTFWGDPKYPEVQWAGLEADKLYEDAVVETIRQNGYRFSGQAHQNAQYGVPVFENGKQYNVSMRHWGRIMAEATGLEGNAYASWAWFPAEKPEVFPEPSEWNESPKEITAQEDRWRRHTAEWLLEECGGTEGLKTLHKVLRQRVSEPETGKNVQCIAQIPNDDGLFLVE